MQNRGSPGEQFPKAPLPGLSRVHHAGPVASSRNLAECTHADSLVLGMGNGSPAPGPGLSWRNATPPLTLLPFNPASAQELPLSFQAQRA